MKTTIPQAPYSRAEFMATDAPKRHVGPELPHIAFPFAQFEHNEPYDSGLSIAILNRRVTNRTNEALPTVLSSNLDNRVGFPETCGAKSSTALARAAAASKYPPRITRPTPRDTRRSLTPTHSHIATRIGVASNIRWPATFTALTSF